MWTAILPLFILVFGWNYLKGAPVVHKFPWPETPGLGSNTALTLLGVYAFAAVCKATDVFHRISERQMIVWFFVSFALCWLPFSNYHCIFSSILAAIGFRYCSKIKLPKVTGRFVAFIAPSMFSVYLLHSTGVIFQLIGTAENPLIEQGVPMVATAFIAGVGVFVVCTALDLARRTLVMPLMFFIPQLFDKVDDIYGMAISRLFTNSIRENL